MKIIKPGVVPEKELLRGTCPTCGCVFDFGWREAHLSSYRTTMLYTVSCP